MYKRSFVRLGETTSKPAAKQRQDVAWGVSPCLYPRFNNQNAINNVIYIVAVAWIDVRIRRMAMPMSFTFRFTSQIAEQIRTVAFKISWVKTRARAPGYILSPLCGWRLQYFRVGLPFLGSS